MAHLEFKDASLSRIELVDETTEYYNSCFKDRWQEAKTILKEFGITLPSSREVDFEGDEYKIQGNPQHFGARKASILYKGTVIANGSIEGCHVGDWEGKMIIYINRLKNVYKPS